MDARLANDGIRSMPATLPRATKGRTPRTTAPAWEPESRPRRIPNSRQIGPTRQDRVVGAQCHCHVAKSLETLAREGPREPTLGAKWEIGRRRGKLAKPPLLRSN